MIARLRIQLIQYAVVFGLLRFLQRKAAVIA
jgi:hypothetical protein